MLQDDAALVVSAELFVIRFVLATKGLVSKPVADAARIRSSG